MATNSISIDEGGIYLGFSVGKADEISSTQRKRKCIVKECRTILTKSNKSKYCFAHSHIGLAKEDAIYNIEQRKKDSAARKLYKEKYHKNKLLNSNNAKY